MIRSIELQSSIRRSARVTVKSPDICGSFRKTTRNRPPVDVWIARNEATLDVLAMSVCERPRSSISWLDLQCDCLTQLDVPKTYELSSSARHLDPLSLLALSHLKHDLYAHEERTASAEQEDPTTPTPNDPIHQSLQSIEANSKAHEISSHHHQDIANGTDSTEHSVSTRSVPPLLCREQKGADDFR